MIRWILLTVLGTLALLPAAASAATVSVTVSPDPLEDRSITFTAVSDQSTLRIFAKVRGQGVPCASSYNAESGTQVLFSAPVGGQSQKTLGEPGAYVICAYLQQFASDTTAGATATIPLTVRPNNATIALRVQPVVSSGVAVPVAIVGTTEVGREIHAKSKPGPAGGCGPSRSTDPATESIAFGLGAIAAFNVPRVAGPFNGPGQYLLCAWLQENPGDPIAEATASAIVNVAPPLPFLTGFDIPSIAFRARGSGPSVTTDSPSGVVTYTLNTAATVRFSVRARRAGRRVGSRCLRATRGRRNRPICARFVPLKGSFTQNGAASHNLFRFSGRIGGKRLRRGSYRLYATPTNATGRGRTLRHVFRIIGG